MSDSALFQHVPVPAYVFRVAGDEYVLEDFNTIADRANPNMAALRGKPMGGLYRDQPQIGADARRCLVEQRTIVLDTPLRRHDKTEVTSVLRITFVPLPPDRIALFVQDVATPAVVESALRESEARYRSLVAAVPNAMVLRGADGRILACNAIAVRLFGAAGEAELLGRTSLLVHDGARFESETGAPLGDMELPFARVLATGAPEAGVVLAYVTAGAVCWLMASAQPVRSATTGAVTGSMTSYTDITDLVTARRRLDLALAAARMGVWEFTPGADRGWWSDNLDDIFAVHEGGGFDRFIAHVHADDQADARATKATLMAGADGETFERELRILGEDGVTRWARLRGRVARDGGAPVTLSGTIMDVTAQHQLETELRRAQRLESLGQLAGGVAHDFNNLLAAMLGSLELALPLCPPAARADLDTIKHGADRARELTRQLLAFAKQQPVALVAIDVWAMIEKVERMLKRLVEPTVEIVLDRQAGDAPLVVRGDGALLEQVVVNLVVNARDAMPRGGRVTIACGARGDLIVLSVSDTGTGMDAETTSHAFDPFFTTKVHGTGLGLASSYGIVRQHGGDIEIDSAPGRGTRFDVLLPAAADAVVAAAVVASDPVAVAGLGTVLVVDDEEIVRTTTVRVLESLDYHVLAADSAATARAIVTDHPGVIDFLVSDVAMPDCDGPTLAAQLLAIRPTLKVVFVSGYAAMPRGVTIQATSARFLQKPYTRDELGRVLASLQ